ncbi:hypothetical protein JYK00_09020 [Thermosipho ferrireducens]|uniref:Uncharacterized protein n=1 Tax=Thermosipho ferrireducens TaxID=2571116 RepID=A0ABX7S5M1_9BACT|nr:hypothetical protein [Thermosipho ferrireducens]QTA37849.1 hypothetical protein JYK00_09020 [Thermosipho ferrireducens]
MFEGSKENKVDLDSFFSKAKLAVGIVNFEGEVVFENAAFKQFEQFLPKLINKFREAIVLERHFRFIENYKGRTYLVNVEPVDNSVLIIVDEYITENYLKTLEIVAKIANSLCQLYAFKGNLNYEKFGEKMYGVLSKYVDTFGVAEKITGGIKYMFLKSPKTIVIEKVFKELTLESFVFDKKEPVYFEDVRKFFKDFYINVHYDNLDAPRSYYAVPIDNKIYIFEKHGYDVFDDMLRNFLLIIANLMHLFISNIETF